MVATVLWVQTEMQEALVMLDRRVTPAARRVFLLKISREALGVLRAMEEPVGMGEVAEVGVVVGV